MPQLLTREDQEVDLDLDAIGTGSFIDSGTMTAISSAHQMVLQSASVALAAVPAGLFQQIAIMQEQRNRLVISAELRHDSDLLEQSGWYRCQRHGS